MKYLFFLQICISTVLAACSSVSTDSTTETPTTGLEDTIIAAHQEVHNTAIATPPLSPIDSMMQPIPSEWKMLQGHMGEWGFMPSCDQPIPQIFLEKSNGQWWLKHTLDYHAENFYIRSVACKEDTSANHLKGIKYTLLVSPDYEETDTFNIELYQHSNNLTDSLGQWVLKPSQEPSFYAPAAHYDKYPLMREDLCMDCADECENDTKLLFGNGVVMVRHIPNKTIRLYNTDEAAYPAHIIILDENGCMEPEGDWVEPLIHLPEENVLHLACISTKNGRYEVVVSRSPYRTIWLDKADDFVYQSWKDYFMNATALDADGQDVVSSPESDEPVEIDPSCIMALDIQGDWLKVTNSPTGCDSTDITGWVRWREDDQLMVHANWGE